MPENQYILSIDQSTSGTKAVIFNNKAEFVARSTAEHKQYYPKPGWVEHDPEEIFENTLLVIRQVINQAAINQDEVYCLSITNQRETVVVWNKSTGEPVYNAIVWQCMRGAEQCKNLKDAGHEEMIRKKTGLLIDPYFSASGLSWVINSDSKIKAQAENGELLAGTIDSWLIWKLTGGKNHYTDSSNACRTLLFNIHSLKWDTEICELFNIPVKILPEVKPADALFGYTTAKNIFKRPVPVCGVLGDSHGALFGQRCFEPGLSKVTYGTGSSVMMNIGQQAETPPEGLVTSIGFGLKDKVYYVFEGNIHSTGATIKWLSDSLKLITSSAESEELANSVDSTDGVYFVPAFAGLGAPYWNNRVKANISGITGGTTKAHIVRAALESIAYQVKDLLDLMKNEAGIELKEIRVDGGPTNNNFLMQFQSDMLNAPISISDIEEASALGAALAGGLGTGIWKNKEEINKLYKSRGKKIPAMDETTRNNLYNGWIGAIKQLLY